MSFSTLTPTIPSCTEFISWTTGLPPGWKSIINYVIQQADNNRAIIGSNGSSRVVYLKLDQIDKKIQPALENAEEIWVLLDFPTLPPFDESYDQNYSYYD